MNLVAVVRVFKMFSFPFQGKKVPGNSAYGVSKIREPKRFRLAV